MDARQPAEVPQSPSYDESTWADLVHSFESGCTGGGGTERANPAANGTNAVDLVMQCLLDSYRAVFGLW